MRWRYISICDLLAVCLFIVEWRSTIALEMESRNGKQCWERYVNHLNPDIKRTPWLPEEDVMIEQLYAEWGSQWSRFMEKLPGKIRWMRWLLIWQTCFMFPIDNIIALWNAYTYQVDRTMLSRTDGICWREPLSLQLRCKVATHHQWKHHHLYLAAVSMKISLWSSLRRDPPSMKSRC